jgi:flavin-dependent dehydrogenase
VASVPDAPPIRESRRVSDVIGKVKMDNRIRGPIGDGVALVGDAALATDPLWGVGCGWAVQSAEWLADALAGAPSLERGLRHYQRTWKRRLAPHMRMIHDYSSGRPFNAMDKRLYATAATDPVLAERMGRVGVRLDSPLAMLRPSTVWRLARGPRRKSAGYSSTTSTSPSLTA